MSKTSLLCFLVMVVVGTDTFLVAPLLPTLTAVYGNSPAQAGWLVSGYALGYGLCALVAGPLSDGHDRRVVMVRGLGAFAVLTALCGLAPTFWAMLALRFAAGVAAAVATPQVWAAIPQIVPPGEVVRAMGHATAGLSIAQMVGVPVGSALAGWSWHAPFLVVGLTAGIVTLLVRAGFPAVPATGAPGASAARRYVELARAPRAGLSFLGYLLFQVGNFTAFTFVGTWLSRDFGLDVGRLGLVLIALGAGNAVGSLFGSRLVARVGRSRTLLLSMLAYLVLYAVLPLSPTLAVAVALLAVIFLIGGLVFPVLMVMMQSLSGTARGTVSSLTNAVMYAGTTIGGVLGGLLLARFPGFFGVAWCTVLAVASALAVWAAGGYFRRPAPTPREVARRAAEQ